MRYLGGQAYDRRQSEEQMRAFMRHWDDHGFGLWAVEHRASGKFVGFIGLTTHTWWPGVEVGWRLDRAYWNRELASEGAAASLEYGFAELALERIISITEPGNAASRRVMEKNGLTFEQRAVLPHNGTEVVILGIDRTEWQTPRRWADVEMTNGAAAGRPALSPEELSVRARGPRRRSRPPHRRRRRAATSASPAGSSIPTAVLIFSLISSMRSMFSARNCLAFSRPWPSCSPS